MTAHWNLGVWLQGPPTAEHRIPKVSRTAETLERRNEKRLPWEFKRKRKNLCERRAIIDFLFLLKTEIMHKTSNFL